MLATVLLAQWGYQNLKTSFNPHLHGIGELDALGIKVTAAGGECLIIETKGQSTTDTGLVTEIEKFASKLSKVREALPELAKKVDYKGELTSVSGIFISMGILKQEKLEHGEDSVTFWDYRKFVRELNRAGIPRRMTDLLQSAAIMQLVQLDDLSSMRWIYANDPGEAPDI